MGEDVIGVAPTPICPVDFTQVSLCPQAQRLDEPSTIGNARPYLITPFAEDFIDFNNNFYIHP